MADATAVRTLGGLLGFGGRRAADRLTLVEDLPEPEGCVFSTRGLGRFLEYVCKTAGPTILDLGPVVGENVSFFGEELGCKLVVEDLFADVSRLAREIRQEPVEQVSVIEARLGHDTESADAVLSWDLFDYLDRRAAESLAGQIVSVLRPGGTVFALFGDRQTARDGYTKYAVVDRDHLEYRAYGTHGGTRRVWGSRDVQRLFGGLTIGETYLLKTGIREMLFRKPLLASRR